MGRGRITKVDEDFLEKIKKIQKRRVELKIDDDKVSIRGMTKKMMKSPNFDKVVEDLLR